MQTRLQKNFPERILFLSIDFVRLLFELGDLDVFLYFI